MAATNGVQKRVEEVQEKVLAQLEGAQKQIRQFEKDVVSFGKTQQKELERLVARVRSGKDIKALNKRAQTATKDLRTRLDRMEKSLLDAVGVASSAEVHKLSGEVARLKKQLAKMAPPAN
jgi:predicted  nucleic acid-binding Zn-ribbon protein